MGRLLETVELEHQSLVDGFVSWVIVVPEPCPLGVEVYFIPALVRQCPEEAVRVEVVVPILHVVRRVGWRERSVVSYRVFRKVHAR